MSWPQSLFSLPCFCCLAREICSSPDIRRLRLLVALVLIIVSVGMVLMALWPEKFAIAFTFIVIFICLLTVILANTWAKKKGR